MKKVFKLSESDLTRIVNRVVKETKDDDFQGYGFINQPNSWERRYQRDLERLKKKKVELEVNHINGETEIIKLSSNPINDLIKIIGNNYGGIYVDEETGNLVIDVVKGPHDLI